ncbi:putative mitochondrial carrier C29A3.11c [Yarrowia sp. C11]|nr:putative mitochondrial carrier C29A3.11c [Yarrowia sp. C11]
MSLKMPQGQLAAPPTLYNFPETFAFLNKLKNNETVHKYRTSIGATIGSLISTTATFPLDSIKTRQQTYNYRGTWHVIYDTYRHEGVKGFYRGIWAPMISTSVVRTIGASVYAALVPLSRDIWSVHFQLPPMLHDPDHVMNGAHVDHFLLQSFKMTLLYLVPGAIAGASSTLISAPFEFTKLSSQVEGLVARQLQTAAENKGGHINQLDGFKPHSVMETGKEILQRAGVRGLYSGYKYHLMRDSISTGFYFTTYEIAKIVVAQKMFGKQSENVQNIAVAFAGACAGIVSWTIIFPLDTLKSVYQKNVVAAAMAHKYGVQLDLNKDSVKINSLRDVFQRRLYKGLSISCVRTAINGAIFFSVLEYIRKRL